ncbi:MAG TPA: pyridoxal-phosphate dependent enzyme, partial [Desulfobacterales bacterium]|nr:pyridoxal-phosphate dependent enzyme [Desulfobacterales bacterium]
MDQLVKKILTSRVYEAAIETSLDEAVELSSRLHNRILLKREDQQPVFSFKIRGAYNRIAHLSETERKCGVITASAGNHAQGVAYASQ